MSRRELADGANVVTARLCAERKTKPRWQGLTAATIAELERGERRWPNAEYREALTAFLGMSEAQLGFYIDRGPRMTGTDTAGVPDPSTTTDTSLPPDLEQPSHALGIWVDQRINRSQRRTERVSSAAGRAAPLASGPSDGEIRRQLAIALDGARRHSGESVVTYFRERLEQSKADDGDLGAATTLPVVLGTLGAIAHHQREANAKVRRELLSVGADGAEFAGWLYRDLLDIHCAVYWYDRAMEWAQEADNVIMQAYVLLKKSQMAYDLHDPRRVLTFAEAARRDSGRLPLRVKAEITQQTALGLAMAGDPIAVIERMSEDAHELLMLALSNADYDGPASAYFTIDTLILRRAACYTVAGKPAKAASLFAEVIAGGSLSRRDSGFFQARWAVALALSGEPDEAAAVGLSALDLASRTDSERTKRVLTNVVRVMKPWAYRPGPRALSEALATSPRSTG